MYQVSIKCIVKEYFSISKKMGWDLPPVRIKFKKNPKVGKLGCLATAEVTWKQAPKSRKWIRAFAEITIDSKLRYDWGLVQRELHHEICHVASPNRRCSGHGKTWKKHIRQLVEKDLYWF